MYQDSEDGWVEAPPRTQAAKAWQVSDQPRPSEKVQVTSFNVFWIYSGNFMVPPRMPIPQDDINFKWNFSQFHKSGKRKNVCIYVFYLF